MLVGIGNCFEEFEIRLQSLFVKDIEAELFSYLNWNCSPNLSPVLGHLSE